MSKYINTPEVFNLPLFLPADKRNNPVAVLADFFNDMNLSEVRGHLGDILKACNTTDNPPFDKPEKRAALLFFAEKAELLFEAAFLLAQGKQIELTESPME